MTIRGGGHPILDMAFVPRFRMGPPPWSFAADAYDCIMVQLATELTAYKFVAHVRAFMANSPRTALTATGRLSPTDKSDRLPEPPGKRDSHVCNRRSVFPDIASTRHH